MEIENIVTGNKELHAEKLLNAPFDLVWEAWTNPEHIAQWWGPKGFTNTIHKMDLIPGGEWKLTMFGADGKRYPNKSVFVEILPFQKIVFQHYNPHYLATIIIIANQRQNLLKWTMQFETAELFETVVKVFKADEGLNQNIEKLEKYLQQIITQKK